MINTILLTGSRGVIGKQLKAALIAKKYRVVGTKRLEQITNKGNDEIVLSPWSKNLDFDYEPDLIIHLAGYYGLENKPIEMQKTFDANVGLASSLAQIIVEKEIPTIAIGSFSEKYPGIEGLSYYAESKIAGKNILREATNQAGVPFKYIYLYDTYSFDTSRKKFIDLLFNYQIGSAPIQASPGFQVQDLVLIDDINACIVKLIDNLQWNNNMSSEYQIRIGKEYTLLETAEIVQDTMGFKVDIRWGSLEYRPRACFRLWDCAENLNSIEDSTTLSDGINKVWKIIKNQTKI
jgi:nucleoside-diphosphate-sugar epimerase